MRSVLEGHTIGNRRNGRQQVDHLAGDGAHNAGVGEIGSAPLARPRPVLDDDIGVPADQMFAGDSEPVKAFETEAQDFFCRSVWMVGSLIQATVGSLGGVGRRPQKQRGLMASAASRVAAGGADLRGGAVVDRSCGVQPDARVVMLMVVDAHGCRCSWLEMLMVGGVEEHLAERSGVFDRAEAGGERRAVLEGRVDCLGGGGVVLTCGREWLRPTPRSPRARRRPWRSSTCADPRGW
jgi:hypothetical protein